MKRITRLAAAIALALIASDAGWAQGTFKLSLEMSSDSHNPLQQMAGRRQRVVGTSPADMDDVPAGVSQHVARFTALIGGRQAPFLLDFASGGPMLYADTDADGRLADEQPVALRTVERQTDRAVPSSKPSVETVAIEYSTFTMRVPGRSRGPVLTLGVDGWIQGVNFAFLSIYPGQIATGEVTLGGKSVQIALVDNTLDGRYDSFLSSSALGDPLSCDAIAIDLDGDGHFGMTAQGSEVLQLSRMVHVEQGYYDLRPARDGSSIRITTARPRMGTLDVDCPDLILTLQSDTGSYQLSGEGGRWELPVGTYRLRAIQLSTTDEAGTTWMLYGDWSRGGGLAEFEIRRGRTTTIPAGPPLTVGATTSASGDAISINFDVTGRAGEHYRPGVYMNGTRQAAPEFTVFDRSGAELVSGSFAYG
jgi:hypothetical protein